MTTPGVEPALADMMDAVFAEHGSDADLWHRLDALGLVRLTGRRGDRRQRGGLGRGRRAVVRRGASRGADPVGRTRLLAGWFLDAAGMRYDAAVRTVCLLDADGAAEAVPWASRPNGSSRSGRTTTGYLAADVAAGTVAITPART